MWFIDSEVTRNVTQSGVEVQGVEIVISGYGHIIFWVPVIIYPLNACLTHRIPISTGTDANIRDSGFAQCLPTLTIVDRLVSHLRNIRDTTRFTGIRGLYKALATMLVESSVLYAVTSVLLIGLWAVDSGAVEIFIFAHAETQVRGSLWLQFPAGLSNVTDR